VSRAGEGGALEIYVYFRADPTRAEAVRAALARQRSLAGQACGAQVRAGMRMEPPDTPKAWVTWLEVYRFEGRAAAEDWPAATLEAIERCAVTSGLADCALAGRHREVFRLES
jgi:hypothetical protein